jgi:hypothetical protein
MLRSAVIMVSIPLTAAEECNPICNRIYIPTCATDGVINRTFGNPCELDYYNCENPEKRKLSSLSQISQQFPYSFGVTQTHNVVKTS